MTIKRKFVYVLIGTLVSSGVVVDKVRSESYFDSFGSARRAARYQCAKLNSKGSRVSYNFYIEYLF